MSLSPLLRIDPSSVVAPFEQLRGQIVRLVAGGELTPGTKLPPVRQLATDLGLAANTVARSYRELEADGVVVTAGRRGTFVRDQELTGTDRRELLNLTSALVSAARRAGLSAPETVALVEQVWRNPASGV